MCVCDLFDFIVLSPEQKYSDYLYLPGNFGETTPKGVLYDQDSDVLLFAID